MLFMMRGWCVVALVWTVGACASPRPTIAPASVSPTAVPASPTPAAVEPAVSSRAQFDQRVEPILVGSCMPCHFPGGKMYDRLPFDDPAVVASHSAGVLRRIKEPEPRAALEAWLRTVAPAP